MLHSKTERRNTATLRVLMMCPFLFFSAVSAADTIQLKSDQDQISISPSTLAIRWNGLSVNDAALTINSQAQKDYRILAQSEDQISWEVLPSGLHITASLTDRKLALSLKPKHEQVISRQQPATVNWFNLNETKSQTLLLPFSEGMRVPVVHPIWAQFLANNYSGSNTAQDLKMPFWTVEQNGTFINYQLLEATNNQLTFTDQQGRVDMAATHQFTPLNRTEPYKVQIALGGNLLSGAKQYRQWRELNNLADPLSAKASRNSEVTKLIGASHVYLFGKDPLSRSDVKDWWGLKHWYLELSGLTIAKSAAKELAGLHKQQGWFSAYHKQLLLESINASLSYPFTVGYPTLSDNTIAAQYRAAQSKVSWLAKHAGDYLIEPNRWGQALSIDMLKSFKQAGLSRLWLGFDNWMPSFYNTEVIEKAKQQGYLVGVYDSYNTAISPGSNDSWLTANLPKEMRFGCAIEMASGKKKSGFRNNGYYLNPNCHLDYVKQRVLDIVKYGRFNSLFLDVDATAMAREDYRDNSSENDMLHAFNQRLAWLGEQTGIVLGSEDGNALTTRGMAFAHGLETVGFGWTDADMTKNRKSKYYLGRWYPDNKPEYFFKSAQVKQPYRSLFFAPQYRVPLYQAVFHDEVINSHHWHTDSLKFSDVKSSRDLTAMLYNTPAMVHLTRDEALSSQSKRVQALKHYQTGFKPIHEQLWDKKLMSFTWLDSKGFVQQTTFEDGSKIIANFLTKPYKHNGITIDRQSIYAKLGNGDTIQWASK
ncbi:glycoside hydrolase [Vibrio tapetis]|uniref:Glycosyl hydrolase n=1 Tax=Vibrio tapetis subsp. tapetis TaxID=1671868 RepID=A0A2N8ZJK1_9VIBR|nr:conserved exported protein of unknown function [Vibrio tapetis subsp. tapetis]